MSSASWCVPPGSSNENDVPGMPVQASPFGHRASRLIKNIFAGGSSDPGLQEGPTVEDLQLLQHALDDMHDVHEVARSGCLVDDPSQGRHGHLWIVPQGHGHCHDLQKPTSMRACAMLEFVGRTANMFVLVFKHYIRGTLRISM